MTKVEEQFRKDVLTRLEYHLPEKKAEALLTATIKKCREYFTGETLEEFQMALNIKALYLLKANSCPYNDIVNMRAYKSIDSYTKWLDYVPFISELLHKHKAI